MNKELNWSEQLLTRADELLSTFGRCTKHYAVDGDGVPCLAGDPEAAGFCITGALQRAAYEMGIKTYTPDSPFQLAIERLERAITMVTGERLNLNVFSDNASDDRIELVFQCAITGVLEYA